MFASMTGFVLAGVILIFIVIGIIAAQISNLKSDEKVSVKTNTVLNLALSGQLTERTSQDPFENYDFVNMSNDRQIGLVDLILNVQKAKDDPKISGIFINIDPDFYVGYASLEDLRNTLIDFKKSKKFIYAYGELYTERSYYLASVADKVFMNPSGELIFNGMASNVTFFRKALEKLGIEMQVFKVGKFKGAVEPFVLDKLSDENRQQIDVYLSSLYSTYLAGIAKSRKIDVSRIQEIADSMLIRNPKNAVDFKMIDKLAYHDEVMKAIKEELGLEKDDDINFLNPIKYDKVKAPKKEGEDTDKQGKIAIIYATGDIVDGDGDGESVGSASINKAIRKARKDDKIKAVVLRINSPGGSALASDIIHRELMLLKKEKPVIVSMGDVAASGGYYIAMAADTIIAQPNTITGSIGVFGLIPNMQKLLNDKMGISFDGVKKGVYADLGRVDRPFNEGEKEIIQNYVNEIYDQFLAVVAKGRKMDKDAVHEIAQGRVWTGNDAKERGLVDVIGGLQLALDIAAEKGGLTNYRIKELPKQKNPFEEFFMGFSAQTKADILKEELGENYKYYMQMKRVMKHQGVLTRMPFEVTIN